MTATPDTNRLRTRRSVLYSELANIDSCLKYLSKQWDETYRELEDVRAALYTEESH